ncbi:MAG: DUF4339 domain-containing protein [Akkermansia sp.]|uniref:DUF4339 domain-containing protein n=1 Tax=Akkermansia sp. TaxID=1872421 RepID=UPI0025C68274|nr:DUF4339 domain-containing protein [Akkermansia sp.]MBS5507818.1 DUF4339 domain-containing protein [Akkermansia sp.]
MEQEQYYIATDSGEAEGPYALVTLKTLYTHGKITKDTLVCIAGGQEWVQLETVLRQAAEKAHKESKKMSLERLMNEYDPIPKKQSAERIQEDHELLTTNIEGLLCIVGVIALITGVLVFLFHAQNQPGIGLIYLLTGAFSCLGCFWCAKVIKLLSRVVDLLSVIAKRIYNVGGED